MSHGKLQSDENESFGVKIRRRHSQRDQRIFDCVEHGTWPTDEVLQPSIPVRKVADDHVAVKVPLFAGPSLGWDHQDMDDGEVQMLSEEFEFFVEGDIFD